MGILYKGVDISKHNSINWNKVRKTEIDFVLIRAGFGVNTVDEKFIENIENAIKCGLDIGVYWFSYASNPIQAKQEAEFCLKTISPYRKYINYPIWFDWEGDSYNYVVKTYNIIPTKDKDGKDFAFKKALQGMGKELKKNNFLPPLSITYYFAKKLQTSDYTDYNDMLEKIKHGISVYG